MSPVAARGKALPPVRSPAAGLAPAAADRAVDSGAPAAECGLRDVGTALALLPSEEI